MKTMLRNQDSNAYATAFENRTGWTLKDARELSLAIDAEHRPQVKSRSIKTWLRRCLSDVGNALVHGCAVRPETQLVQS